VEVELIPLFLWLCLFVFLFLSFGKPERRRQTKRKNGK
jgi:hypothetical protein